MGCCMSVQQSELVMVQKCGRHSRVLNPGFACLNPFAGECVAGSISLRVKQLDVRCDTKSKDNVFVHVTASVQYQVIVDQVYDSFYKLTDPRQQITAYVFDGMCRYCPGGSRGGCSICVLTDSTIGHWGCLLSVVRSTVPRINLDDVFETKDEIAHAVKNELAKSMHEFGYLILQVLITEIDPDSKVKLAMNEINAAQRLRVAATDKAEAEKILVVKAAEAGMVVHLWMVVLWIG
jgi:regulator of protease activity HflC (stomatin/prohibitin superfamily)